MVLAAKTTWFIIPQNALILDIPLIATVMIVPRRACRAAWRDLALLCEDSLPVAEIEEAIKQAGGSWLEKAELFDVYQGEQIEKGKKSVAYALSFREPERTLTDEDVQPLMESITQALLKKGCVLRG